MTKIKDLPFKEKVDNIWYYYKFHILGSILLVIFIVSMIHSSLTSPKYVFNISVVGFYDITKSDEVKNIEDNITDLVVDKSDKRERASLELYAISKKDGRLEDMDPNYCQKLLVKIGAGDVDILVINRDDFEKLMEQDSFLKLNDMSKVEESKLIKKGTDVYGISVEGNKVLDKIGYNTKDKVMGIIVASKNPKQAKKVMEWMLETKDN